MIVSNRGPVSFDLVDATPVARRGAGGLTSALAPLIAGTDTLWVAAAMTEGDRVVAGRGVTDADDFRVRLLSFDEHTWKFHYDTVCNEALWFVHHGLFDPVYEPAWPPGWLGEAWAAHRLVNEEFAAAVGAEAAQGSVVLIQDYHLCLMGQTLRDLRPDLHLVHFSHTPFAPPAWLRMLPRAARQEMLQGLAAHHGVGFHTARWAQDFEASCLDNGVTAPKTFVAPLGPDPEDLERTARSSGRVHAASALEAVVGDKAFIVRVDRIELSKNILRGFLAYEALLESEPKFHGRIVFGAYCYPSRQGVAAYDRYAQAVQDRVDSINARFGTSEWTPVHYDPTDDYARSVAALMRADVVVVNPIRDGLNLVAKEAMVLNERNAQLVLSAEAGAWAELGEDAWGVDPFDVAETASALGAALEVSEDERIRRFEALRAASLARTPEHWLADQVRAVGQAN